jgi:hypothetical protein
MLSASDLTLPGSWYTRLNEHDTIFGFSRSEGDKIQVGDLLANASQLSDELASGQMSWQQVLQQSFVFVEHGQPGDAYGIQGNTVTQRGLGTYVYFDPDGATGGSELYLVADLAGVTRNQVSSYDFVL